MSDFDELTSEVLAIVTRVPGVAEVYPARPVALALVDQLVQTALPVGSEPRLISISQSNGVTRTQIRIAVSEASPAADICRDVYAAVSEHLTSRGIAAFEVTVTVARIV